MPIDSKGYLTTPSDTSTEKVGVVGEIREYIDATHGKQFYRMVQNTSGADIAANVAVVFISGSTTGACALAGAAQPAAYVAGITQNIIPDTEYGWVCCGGNCTATSGSALAANSLLSTILAAGALEDTAVSGIEHCIIAVNPVVVGSATTFTARVCNLI